MKALLLSLMLSLFPLFAQANVEVPKGRTWVVEVEKVSLKSFTKEIAKITEKNFIVSDDISETPISLTTRKAVTPDELLDYYVNAMHLHNIRVIQDGDLYKVVRDIGGLSVHKLNYANADYVANMLNSLSLNNVRAVADITTNSVLVRSDLSADLSHLIKSLDTKRNQILIQAVIAEISADDVKQLGVQWVLGNKQGYGVVNFNPKASLASAVAGSTNLGVLGGLIGYSKNEDNKFYGAILHALEQTTTANLLSMPSVLALDNEQASIMIGQNVPVLTGRQLDKNGEPFQAISRLDVGISLKVTPTISDDGKVKLKVYQEVSNVVSATNDLGIITNKSVIETNVLANDGETIVLGGLMRDESSKDKQALPGISKIPLLGRAFKSDSKTAKKSNLVIFLQPTVIKDELPEPIIRDYATNSIVKLVLDEHKNLVHIPLTTTEN